MIQHLLTEFSLIIKWVQDLTILEARLKITSSLLLRLWIHHGELEHVESDNDALGPRRVQLTIDFQELFAGF